MSSNGTFDNTLRPCSSSPASVQSWLDLANMPPKCPPHLIAYADLGGTAGTVINSSSFVITAGTWSASPFTIVSAPLCVALGSDSLQNVADARQWNFQHLTAKVDVLSPVPLNKLIYLWGGTQWIKKNINDGMDVFIKKPFLKIRYL